MNGTSSSDFTSLPAAGLGIPQPAARLPETAPLPQAGNGETWKQEILGVPRLNLPLDRPRPARLQADFAQRTFALGRELSDRIGQFGSGEQIPLPVLLLTAFLSLLSRYTSQEEIVIGFSGLSAGAEDGSVARADLSGDLSFRALLGRIKAAVALAQTMPSARELRAAGADADEAPFQVAFSWQGSHDSAEPALISGAAVDLHLDIDQADEELRLRLFYKSELLEAASIERTARNLRTLLQAVAQNPGQALSQLPILTEEEKREILVRWNRTECEYPREKCLHELVAAQAELAPEALAALWGTQRLSYKEFNAQANQLAHYLRSLGSTRNSRVGICLPPSLDFAVAILAVLKAGASCLPLDPNYPPERLSYMLQDAQAGVLIAAKDNLPAGVPADCRVLFLSEMREVLAGQSAANPVTGVTPQDIAYVIYTSGSTGKPRGVLLSHAGLVNYNWSMARTYELTPRDRMLQFCSISFDITIEELFVTWTSGAAVVFKSGDTPLAVPELMVWAERQGITILDLPTAYWHEWVHQLPELERPYPASLRVVIVGGEKASAKAYEAWLNAVGHGVRWINCYGPTEASIGVTVFEPDFEPGTPVPENLPIGKPIANTRIYLLDRDLNPVPVGVAGELHIGGVAVARGYLNRPELTAEKFIPDPFSSDPTSRLYKSGDQARYLPSGEIEFLGRRDEQVKIRGFRVELGEIESVLGRHPGVRECAVVARENNSGDKSLVAYVVFAVGEAPSKSDLRGYLQQQLPHYMVPPTFVVLETMPLTPNGKVNRRGLPAPEPEPESGDLVGASDALQSQLLGIWEDVLGKKRIGIRDNFFELGGHSLLAARLMHRIGQALEKTLPLAMLFEAPTVEQLAAALAQNGWARHWSSLVPIQPAGLQPPFFCVHGVGGNVIGLRELGKCMAPDHPFYGLQSQGLDGTRPCHGSIPEMALHYIHEIRGVQPNGPYFLGGFSFGGLVAYEMAQQLRAGGEEVALLVLFDTYPGNLKPVSTSLVRLLLRPTWKNLSQDLPKVVRKRIQRRMKWWRKKVPQALWDVRRANAAAADKYTLQPFAGKATLIRAAEKPLRGTADPHAAWYGLIDKLEVHEIPGDHFDILVQPQVRVLASCLKSCVDAAAAECESDRVGMQAS